MLLPAFTLCTAYVTGPTSLVGDRTGSPINVVQQRCGTCHRGGDYAPVTKIELLDGDGASRRSYVPGQAYTLRISIAASGTPAGYGVQAVVIDESLAGQGTFGDAPDNFRIAKLDGRDYLEHTGLQTSDTVEVAWVAPAAGVGPLSVYAAGNAVNGANGTSGDAVDEDVLTLREARSSAAEARAPEMSSWTVFAADASTLAFSIPGARQARDWRAEVYAVDGRQMARALSLEVSAGRQNVALPSALTPGLYVVRLYADGRPVGARVIAG